MIPDIPKANVVNDVGMWLSFISNLVGDIAWPLTIVTIFFMLRKQIYLAFDNLAKIRYKDVEIDFAHEIKSIEDIAIDADIFEKKGNETVPSEIALSEILKQAWELSDKFPVPAVGHGWTAIEEEISDAIRRLSISPDYPPYVSSLKKIDMLYSSNYIDIVTKNVLDRLRKLRNITVHGGHSKITCDDAREFISTAAGVVQHLRSLRR